MEDGLLYVDDVLVVSEKAESIISNENGQYWRIKESTIEKPSLYLGGRRRKVELTDGTKCWAFGSSQYVQAAVKNFAYLRKYHNAEMLFDPSLPHVDPSAFQRQDWTFSAMTEEDMKEVLPPYMPASRGRGFVIRVFVDADHAGDEITRRSRTGFIVYINNAPVYWYSKRQGSVESSTYQAEFTAMKEAAEYVRALRYKLRMMGIPVEGQPLSLEIISRCRCQLVRSAMGL